MEKRRFEHEFAILALLAFAVVAIVFQSHFNLTGNVVSGDYINQTSCEAANYSWYNNTCVDSVPSNNSTVVSNDTINNSTDSSNNSTTNSTVPLNNTLTNSTTCTYTLSYSEWSNCISGDKTRTLTNTSSCNETIAPRVEHGTCAVCSESWSCDSWTNCSSGTQTRICTDANSCGTTANKLPTQQNCTDTTSSTQTNIPPITAEVTQPLPPTCTPNWQCGEWQECVAENQARVCTDVNNCGTQEGIPTTSQTCVSVPVNETPVKSNKNFFTMVGGVINGPLGSVGKFFSNKTNVFIASGTLVLVISGIVGFRFFRKHRKFK